MRNETKIGILAAVAIVVLVWGYNFLKGQNILTRSGVLYAEYTDVALLEPSSPVVLRGMEVGVVTTMEFKSEVMDTILVAISLDRGVDLPENAVLSIVDQSLMGGKAVQILLNIPCSEKFPCPTKENYRRGATKGFLSSVLGNPKDISPFLEEIGDGLSSLLDTLNAGLEIEDQEKGLGKTLAELSQTVSNLKVATGYLGTMLSSSSKNIGATTANLASVTGNLADQNAEVTQILGNAASFTDQLKESELEQTIGEAKKTMVELQEVLAEVKATFTDLNTLTTGLSNGEGTLGKLLSDENLYENLKNLSFKADTLLADFQDRPYRYMPLKNRKRVKRYDKKDAAEQD